MNNNNFEYIAENIKLINAKINNKARLMAVTKNVDVEKINYAIKYCGINLIGENKVQELCAKYDYLEKNNLNNLNNKDDRLEINFIGTLQTNKVKYIIDKVDMIQSVNSLKLAEEINKRANSYNKIMDILIEINIGNEASKTGLNFLDMKEAERFLEEIKIYKNIRTRGIMVIPPLEDETVKIIEIFKKTRKLFEELKLSGNFSLPILSMGMSGDYEQAIECGSDIVRIGSAIFGHRD